MSRSRTERAAAALTGPALGRLARRAPKWRGVVVLNYHRVGRSAGQQWDRTLWNADEETFDAQLATLAREAEVVTPDDVALLPSDRRPGRRVMLTFDDGYRDNYELAFPLLRRHGLRATFFIASGFLDVGGAAWWDELAWMVRNASTETLPSGPWSGVPLPLGPDEDGTVAAVVKGYKALDATQTEEYLERVAAASGAGRCDAEQADSVWMTWKMVREMHAAGMSIGGHTVTHPILARIPAAEQRREIAGSRARLREELDVAMDWFAYPVGSRDAFSERTKQILREHDVRLAFSFYGGYARAGAWDPFDVPRVHVGGRHGPELLRATLLLPRLFTRP
ncbi:MAG TPA: polysaccharide deacetylase family protein [Solirubrobacteraceae bacterium]|nr:polysaccharide deacetylase family protein [Solirubrobacteraceae bacterium]